MWWAGAEGVGGCACARTHVRVCHGVCAAAAAVAVGVAGVTALRGVTGTVLRVTSAAAAAADRCKWDRLLPGAAARDTARGRTNARARPAAAGGLAEPTEQSPPVRTVPPGCYTALKPLSAAGAASAA